MALEEKHQNQITCEDPQCVPTLLTEIIFEILLRVPVDSLLRCRSVCKSWCSLISDPHFVKSHLRFSTSNNNYAHHRLMFNTQITQDFSLRIDFKTCNPYDVLRDNSIKALDLDSPFEPFNFSVSIVGSCNGMFCMIMEEYDMFIWNPSTRKCNRLTYCGHENPLCWYVLYGFGYDEYTDDYKVVKLSCNVKDRAKGEVFVQIYSLKNGRWEKRGSFPHGLPFYGYGKFSNGCLHWSGSRDFGSTSSWIIVSFDLAEETYGEVSQPVYGEGDDKDLTLGLLRERLCVLCSNYPRTCADLWVMKVYGVRDSWTKLVSIPYLTDPVWDKYSVPLCISNDGKVLLRFGSTLVVYDSNKCSFSHIQNVVIRYIEPCTFVESLVSPDSPRRSWR